jgi:D-inositol-3-phosphate glycosyltransferase
MYNQPMGHSLFFPSIAMISFHTCPLASQEGKETGGMNVYVLELSKQLARTGMKVDIFTRAQDASNPKIVQIEENLRLMHLSAGPTQPVAKKDLLKHIPEFAQKMSDFIDEEKIHYDVIDAHYYMSGLVALELEKRRTQLPPLLLTFHTLALMKNLVARTEQELESSERIDAEFLLAKRAQKIICPSESERSYTHYLYGVPEEKIAIVPPGVDVSLFSPMDKIEAKKKILADPEHKVVLFAGRIEPLKGIDVLIYAMKILLTKHPHWEVCLWIVGGDVSGQTTDWSRELKKLEQLRRVLKIPRAVHFVGQKSQSELRYYYNAAEVVVMPSHYESFGMAAAEAMACGVPVITTNVSGIANFLDEKHKSLVTSANNPLLLATHIEEVIENQKKYLELSESIRQKVQDLGWKNIAQKMSKIYTNMFGLKK